jgi:hypothetical protein
LSRALLVVSLIGAGGCRADLVRPEPVAEPVIEPFSAPLSVTIEGQRVVLVPYLYRDFQPIAPPDGRPLIAVLRVQSADGTPLATTTFRVDAALVHEGSSVWIASVGEERLASPSPVYYEVVARDGPKWAPGTSVDVVVRIRERSGAIQHLRATGQLIQRTE